MTWYPMFGDRGVRLSGYGWDPIDHPAIDITPADAPNGFAANGANIYAPLGGQVTWWGQSPDSPGKDRGLHMTIRLDDWHVIDICHMAGVPWPDTPPYWTRVERGQHLGFLGHTGTTNPSGPGGAHVHLIVMDETGQRIDPTPLVFPQEDAMNDAQKAEAQAVADILDSWALNNERREQAALAAGYGINDSYSNRQASDLRGLALRVRGLEAL